MSIYTTFKEKGKKQLQKALGKKNINEVPKIDKVIVSMWIGSLATRKGMKDFSELEKNLITITGQKPIIIKSKKAISNFKLREDMPVMLQVTLRRQKAHDFLERLNKLVLPRVRDFAWLVSKKFDGRWNYNVWFPSQAIFPDLTPEEVIVPHGLQVNICTSTSNDNEAKELLKNLWFIFKD